MIKYATESEEGEIRVENGIKLEGEFQYLQESKAFGEACHIIFDGVARLHGLRNEVPGDVIEQCMQVGYDVLEGNREVVRNTFMAGLDVLANALWEDGYEKEAWQVKRFSSQYVYANALEIGEDCYVLEVGPRASVTGI